MDRNSTILFIIKTPETYSDMKYVETNSNNDSNVSQFWEVTINPEIGTHGWALRLIGDIILGIVLGFLCLLTAAGNAMVLHAVRTERALQSVSNMYIVSLAVADLTVGLIVMPISTVYIFTDHWLFGVAVCQFWIGVDYIASTASILNLFILSLDRYWSVTSPLRYLRKRTKRRAFLMITTVWFISSLWLLPIVGWHHLEHGGKRTVPNHVCDTEYATNTALKIITGILNYYLPLAVMYALYTKIFIEIKKRSKMEVGQKNHGGSVKIVTKELPSTSASGEAKAEGDIEPCNDYNVIHHHLAIPLTHIANGIQRLSRSGSKGEHTDTDITSPSSPPPSKPLLAITTADASNEDDDVDSLYVRQTPVISTTLVQCPSLRSIDACDQLEDYYTYDEVVIDPQTEKIHRYCSKNSPSALVCNNSGLKPPKSHMESDQTSSCSSIIYDYYDSEVQSLEGFFDTNYVHVSSEDQVGLQSTQVQMNLPSDVNDSETRHMFPKENHPAKNHFVIKRCNRPASMPSPHTDNSHYSNGNGINVGNHARPHSDIYEAETKHEPDNSKSNYSYLSVKATSPTSSLMRRLRQTIRHRHQRINNSLQKEIKAAKQLGVIMSAFTVCFLPYFVCFMVVAFCEACVPTNLTIAVTWIGYLNSTLNPFLYPLCNDRFKRKFRKMLHIGPKEKRRSYYTGALHRTGTFRRKPKETLHS